MKVQIEVTAKQGEAVKVRFLLDGEETSSWEIGRALTGTTSESGSGIGQGDNHLR